MKVPSINVLLLGATLTTASNIFRRARGAEDNSTAEIVDVLRKSDKQDVGPPKNAAGNAAGVGPPIENSCNVNGAIVPKVFIVSMVFHHSQHRGLR
jgi:hypothetical protein